MYKHCQYRDAFVAVALIAISAIPLFAQDHGTIPADHAWVFDSIISEDLLQRGGQVRQAAGVQGKSTVLDGRTLLEVKNSDTLIHSTKPFTLLVWFNPYHLDRGQQMIVAKNRYSLGEREWGLMLDRDQKLRLYVHQSGWKTLQTDATLMPGRWHQAGLVFQTDKVELWLNGTRVGEVNLSQPIPQTEAPLTFGGVNDNGRIWQNFWGALDEARLFRRALTAPEMGSLYSPVDATHSIPDVAKPVSLWDDARPLPVAADIQVLNDVSFRVIKKWDQQADGYTFLHGVGLGWHKGKLYASIGHNKGAENTVTEEAQYRVSGDQGRTWSELRMIDNGGDENLAVSHGVFLSHAGKLWAFHGAYYDKMKNIHTRAYSLDENTGEWIKHGIVVENGFWPMNQPVRMDNGNWVMPGISAGPYTNDSVFPAAVAISHGDDFTNWDYVEIPADEGISRMWGESALFIDGARIFNIARYGGGASALLATSGDAGRTWTPSIISNLPMATSKPAAGTLSNGQHFLICTTAKNNGGKRTPLTIAVTAPGENIFRKVFVIRRSRHPDNPGESADSLSLSYPCAIEHAGHLYVGYSNNGGRRGNLNSAEMAIIPLAAIQIR
ncbi:MAG TPA: cycloinulo-oligosaccharide fructanotransferase [Planctomycetaceae bacterium]|nr:cycloinulo-oligosaccharide fructanotransferase [Planctomycetaceae bacterium]